MAERIVQIKIDGDDGGYRATVERIIEKNNQLNRSAIQGAQQTMAAWSRMQSVLSGVGTQLAGLVSVGAFIVFARQAIEAAGRIQDLADQTGLTARTLSGLKTPLEQSGVTLDDFANGVVRLQKSLVDSRGEQTAFALKMRDLLKVSSDPEQFLQKFAQKLADIKNPAERTAFALEAASRGGAKLGPVFLQIADQGLDKFRNSASAMANETVARLDELGDAFVGFKNQVLASFGTGIGALGDFSGAVRQFGSLVGSTIAFILAHKDAILLLGAGVAALTGHWLAAAAALAAYIGLANNYRGDLGALNALNEKQLALEQQLLTVEEARRKGQRSGLASDEVYNRMLADQNNLTKEKQTLIDKLRADNDKPAATQTTALGLGDKEKEQLLKNAQALANLRKEIDQVNLSILQESANLRDTDSASDEYRQKLIAAQVAVVELDKAEKIAAAEKDNTIGAVRGAINELARQKINLIDVKEQAFQYAKSIEQITNANKFLADSESAENAQKEQNRQEIETEFNLRQQLLSVQLETLRAKGLESQAAQLELTELIRLNEERKKALDQAAQEGKIFRQPGENSLADAQINLAKTKLEQLGVASVNVGHAIADTLNDIFTAAIQGTLKFSDIGKSLLAGVARTAGDFFTQVLNKKLGFENIILSNMNGLPGQMNSAFTSGVNALPGGQIGQGGGVVGPGGGGQPNIFGGNGLFSGLPIGNLLGNIFSNGGTTGFGSAPAGVAGPALSNGGFFSNPLGAFQAGGGSLFSGGAAVGGGLLASLLNTGWQGQVGSLLGNVVGSLAASTTIGTAITTSIAGALSGVVGGTIAGLLAGMVIPGIGAIIGVLISLLFKHVPNPTVFVKTVLGFFYDQTLQAFSFFEAATITKALEIKGSKAKQVLEEHQQILNDLGDKFTDLLNIFPTNVHDVIAAQLDNANRVLGDIFGSKKYTDLGKRNIRKELDDLKEKEGPLGFFVALRGAIGAGIGQTLNLAGLPGLTDLINQQLPAPPNPTPRDFPFRGGAGGLLPPEGAEEFGKFIDALKQFAGFTSTLANISPRGITPFLTDADKAQLQAEIAQVLLTPGDKFAGAVDQMLERVKPLADFLQTSVTEASNLFGKGLMAAFDAATDSDASRAFLDTLHEGVREKILSGITESFIASAQFTDLLAPIQQTIRDFTQQALATGQTPDIDAFRRALLPAIEDISTRGETLDPLVQALRDLIGSLGLLTDQQQANSAPHVEINIENYGNDMTPQELARMIGDMLNGSTAPPS